jgi:hypothetical protein
MKQNRPKSKFATTHDLAAIVGDRMRQEGRVAISGLAAFAQIHVNDLNYKISSVKRLRTGEGAVCNKKLAENYEMYKNASTAVLLEKIGNALVTPTTV